MRALACPLGQAGLAAGGRGTSSQFSCFLLPRTQLGKGHLGLMQVMVNVRVGRDLFLAKNPFLASGRACVSAGLRGVSRRARVGVPVPGGTPCVSSVHVWGLGG